jgi:hypothetical protein
MTAEPGKKFCRTYQDDEKNSEALFVQDNGQRRFRYNKELYELYYEPDLVTCIS